MAKAMVNQQIEYGLKMNPEEHKYLMGLLQNDITGNESNEDAQHRQVIFEELKRVEVRT